MFKLIQSIAHICMMSAPVCPDQGLLQASENKSFQLPSSTRDSELGKNIIIRISASYCHLFSFPKRPLGVWPGSDISFNINVY